MSKIEYKREFLDIVYDLSKINNTVVFKKSEDKDKIFIFTSDSAKLITYRLEAPIEYFNIPEDQIAFYKYGEFYTFLNVFHNPEFKFKRNKIIISEGDSKFNYLLVEPDLIKVPQPKKINFGECDLKFNLTSTTIDNLSKMINSLIKAKQIKIYGNENKINMNIFADGYDNSFEKSFDVEQISDFSGDFSFNIYSDLITSMPNKKDYIFHLKFIDHNRAFVKATLIHENINLDIYTAHKK